jgi:nitric oxide dioxygenase
MVDLARVGEAILKPDANYYLCGPAAFMSAQIKTLKSSG